ncbi:MAG: TIGR02281 family clan AA aspartic protease [Pseudomonadota bacterium]
MKLSHIFTTFLLAVAVAAIISFYLNPKLEEEAHQASSVTPMLAAAKTAPEPAQTGIRRTATLRADHNGHFWTRALVNRKSTIEFMVDTGATSVALTFKDAQKIGLRPETLDYTIGISTAGGRILGAPVQLEMIQVGQIRVRDVYGVVVRSDLEHSLLGNSFLRELHSRETRGDRMIMQQ